MQFTPEQQQEILGNELNNINQQIVNTEASLFSQRVVRQSLMDRLGLTDDEPELEITTEPPPGLKRTRAAAKK